MNDVDRKPPLIRTCTLVYLLLMALTCVTWAIGRAGMGGQTLALLVLGIALLKGQLIGDWFMGLRALRGPWRWVIVAWLTIPGGLIALAFILADGG